MRWLHTCTYGTQLRPIQTLQDTLGLELDQLVNTSSGRTKITAAGISSAAAGATSAAAEITSDNNNNNERYERNAMAPGTRK